MNTRTPLILLLAVIGLVTGFSSIYQVGEWEQVILTQFGRKVGQPVTKAGIHLKTPFVQTVNRIEKRVLEWDGRTTEMPTRDKLYILVDTFARWRITDPVRYFERLRDERSAISRLDDILGGETRNAVARHDLIEIIRTSKDRTPANSGEISKILGTQARLDTIKTGRPAIEHELFVAAKPKLAEFGIDLLDIRFKRINYNPSVERRIFERMVSERQQIAEFFRSEGAGEAQRILGEMKFEVDTVMSEAYKKVQTIAGEADGKATAIYAKAYSQSPEAAEFYRFKKTLETYESSLGGDTTVILSTDSPLLRYLQSEQPVAPTAPSNGR